MKRTVKGFDAVAFTRSIRDSHHEQLKEATPEERAQFYRAKAQLLHQELGLPSLSDPGSVAGRQRKAR